MTDTVTEAAAVVETAPTMPFRPARNSPQHQQYRIAEFLRSLRGKDRLSIVSLVHLVLGNKGTATHGDVILTYTFDSKPKTPAREAEIDQVAIQFSQLANSDIETHTTTQRYGVIGATKVGQEENVLGRYAFLLSPPPGNFTGGTGLTEPANSEGVLALSMRLTEGVTHLMVQDRQSVMDRLLEENDRLRAENAHLRENHWKIIENSEALLDRKADRELKLLEKKNEFDMGQRLMGQAEKMLPAVVAKIAPSTKPFFDNSAGASSAKTIQNLVASLSPEQMENIRKTLTQEQYEALVTSMMAVMPDGG